ncbi:MAG: DNA alkylation repair protein [Oscillospiraceae bacterium]
MSGLFKDRFNYESLYKLALEIQTVYDRFPIDEFLKSTMDERWNNLEFKQRVMQIGENLGKYLPSDYKTAIHIIDKVIMNYNICLDGFVIFFPAFVELYGQDEENWDVSMAALARYTPYASAEFAVRTFIMNDETRMMEQMAAWARHDNEHIRRLASEGCRPRLPWGRALPNFQKDPFPVLRILEQLKADPSPYVRKSVANNLNDISKTHPDLVVKIARDWYGKDEKTDWIVKHGCRTLLKKGNSDILGILGFADASCVKVDGFSLGAATVPIGADLTFSFEIEANKATKIRLEYGIDYVKASGRRNRKIFQISELIFKENGKKTYIKTHSLADTSTRKHYPEIHSVTLIINGVEQGTQDFEVLTAE